MLSYLTFKSIHMLGIVLFLGNIIVTGVWKYRADITRRIADGESIIVAGFTRDGFYLSGDLDSYWSFHIAQEQARLYPKDRWKPVVANSHTRGLLFGWQGGESKR